MRLMKFDISSNGYDHLALFIRNIINCLKFRGLWVSRESYPNDPSPTRSAHEGILLSI